MGVALGQFCRIAFVGEVEELGALDDAPLVDVEGDVRCIEVQCGERGVMYDRRK